MSRAFTSSGITDNLVDSRYYGQYESVPFVIRATMYCTDKQFPQIDGLQKQVQCFSEYRHTVSVLKSGFVAKSILLLIL